MASHYVRIEEAGAVVEIFGNMPDNSFWINITDEQGELRSVDAKNWDEVCSTVEQWYDKNVPADDPRRFKGFQATIRNHETNLIEKHSFNTRGALLQVWTDGSVPTLDEFIEGMRWSGDNVIVVQDGSGAVLADLREEVKASMRRWMERDLEENLAYIDEAAEEAIAGDQSAPKP